MTITRRIDDLGRIVIPNEIREAMGIKAGEALDITNAYGGERIIIEKATPAYSNDEPTQNISNDRKMYIMRFEDRITDFILLTEDQINLLKWLSNNDYLHDDVYYDECAENEFKVI